MKVVRIRIPSQWVIPPDARYFKRDAYATADFKLGLGPCGKVVQHLSLRIREGVAMVTQTHSDGTYKVFYYPLHQVTGRIEEEYEGGSDARDLRDRGG